MSNKDNNDYSKDSLNRQIEKHNIPNVEPIKIPNSMTEILDHVIENTPETTFINLLESSGADISEYYTSDKTIKITEDHKCALAVVYGLDIAKNLGYPICNKHCKDKELVPYIYNGKYWELVKPRELSKLFRLVLVKSGMDKAKATILPRLTIHINNAMEVLANELPERDISKRKLNLANGVIELVDGKVQFDKFDSANGFTYNMTYEYMPTASAPLFTKYLDRILPDKESQAVLQEAMGLALINENVQKIPYLLGEGSNGKSVLNEIMLGIFGCNMKRITLRNLMGDKSERNQAMIEGIF